MESTVVPTVDKPCSGNRAYKYCRPVDPGSIQRSRRSVVSREEKAEIARVVSTCVPCKYEYRPVG